jgi:hypothetical protein
VARFGPALLALESVGVYHTAPLPYGAEAVPATAPVQVTSGGEYVLGLFGRSARATAFMIVNRDYSRASEATVRVEIPGKGLQELDRETGRWSASKALGANRSVKIQLQPGDGRLFRVEGPVRLSSPRESADIGK